MSITIPPFFRVNDEVTLDLRGDAPLELVIYVLWCDDGR